MFFSVRTHIEILSGTVDNWSDLHLPVPLTGRTALCFRHLVIWYSFEGALNSAGIRWLVTYQVTLLLDKYKMVEYSSILYLSSN